jgi:hypothetical protein
MDNLHIYNRFRVVPAEAKKTIAAGKLKGFTDVNPMWRLKALTEMFGPCGFGWYIADEQHWTETIANETAVFCKVLLVVKHPETNEWSAPIIGIGGSKLAGKGNGDGLDDEAYMMAYTDAISIACKNLSMAADVYYEKDRTMYNSYAEASASPKSPALSAAQSDKEMMHQNHPKWNAMLESILAGKTTLEKVKAKYCFPEADEIAAKDWLLNHQDI